MQSNQRVLEICVLPAVISLVFVLIALYIPVIIVIVAVFIPVPILLVAFQQGSNAGVLSALFSAIPIFLLFPWLLASFYILFFFVPAVFLGWISMRDKENYIYEKTKNTPQPILPVLFFILSLIVAIAAILIMSFISLSENKLDGIDIDIAIDSAEMFLSAKYPNMREDFLKITTLFRTHFLLFFGMSYVFYSILLNLGSLHVAVRFAKKMKYQEHLLEDWPATLRMPREAFFLLISCWLILWFYPEKTLYYCAFVVFMSLFLSFFVSGYAFIHHITRKWPCRFLILPFFYTGLFTVIPIPVPLFIGIFAAFHFSYKNGKFLHP